MIEVPMAVALAIAYGSTSRTFGADAVQVRKTLAQLTGLRVPFAGPVMASMMRMCAQHVERQLPAVGAPPPAAAGDIADYGYLSRAASLYGPSVSLRTFPGVEG